MTLSSTTIFIIQASNTGRYAKLMGNGGSYRLPGRKYKSQLTFRRGNPQASETATLAIRRAALSAARVTSQSTDIMSKPKLSAVQSDANDKVNEFPDDDKTTGADWESALRACLQYKSK
jgi:hypothetical protein